MNNPHEDMRRNNRYSRVRAMLGGIRIHAPNTVPVILDDLTLIRVDHDTVVGERNAAERDLGTALIQIERQDALLALQRAEIERLHERLDNFDIDDQQRYFDQDMRARLIEQLSETEAIHDNLRRLMGVES